MEHFSCTCSDQHSGGNVRTLPVFDNCKSGTARGRTDLADKASRNMHISLSSSLVFFFRIRLLVENNSRVASELSFSNSKLSVANASLRSETCSALYSYSRATLLTGSGVLVLDAHHNLLLVPPERLELSTRSPTALCHRRPIHKHEAGPAFPI